ncbi:MAG: LytR/AlgR family response regulator transcription factor [Candidatus Ornithomonoglobus sp.]
MIMLIEHNEDDMKKLKKYVMQCYPGEEIADFNNSRQALINIQSENFDITMCFTAVVMPEVSGFRIARELRSRSKRTKIVFVCDTPDYAVEAWQHRVNDYLLKPVTAEKVKHTQKL